MEDRELLEMAAKATGIVGLWHERGQCIHVTNCSGLSDVWWRPLEDDGDALRLAVTLGLSIERGSFCVYISSIPTEDQSDADERGADLAAESLGVGALCPFKATRRAIVRAAAEIGKRMP